MEAVDENSASRSEMSNDQDDKHFTSLCQAIQESSVNSIHQYLASLEIEDRNGRTPLMVFLEQKNQRVIKLLLDNGVDVNHETTYGHPFHMAVSTMEKKVIEPFLNKGVPINTKNRSGDTCLHVYCRKRVEEDKRFAILKYLLTAKADVNAENNEIMTPLCCAIKYRSKSLIRKLLKIGVNLDQAMVYSLKMKRFNTYYLLLTSKYNDGCPVDAIVPFGEKQCTILQAAIKVQNLKLIGVLLENGADPNKRGDNTLSPLLLAILHCRPTSHVIPDLLKKGADPNWQVQNGTSALHCAVAYDKKQVLATLLLHGANPNISARKRVTSLHCAAFFGRTTMISILVPKGARLNKKMSNGFTPLHIASAIGCNESAEELLEYGADIDAQDNSGCTPLHHAVETANYHLICMLLLHGANVLVPDKDGDTPLNNEPRRTEEPWAWHRRFNPILPLFGDQFHASFEGLYTSLDREEYLNIFDSVGEFGIGIEGRSRMFPVKIIFENYKCLCRRKKQILGWSEDQRKRFLVTETEDGLKKDPYLEKVIEEIPNLYKYKIKGVSMYEMLTEKHKVLARKFISADIDRAPLKKFSVGGCRTMLAQAMYKIEKWKYICLIREDFSKCLTIRLPQEVLEMILNCMSLSDLKKLQASFNASKAETTYDH